MKGAVPGLLQSDTRMRKRGGHREGPVTGGKKRRRKLRIRHRFNCTFLFKCDPRFFSWDIKQCSAKLKSRSILLVSLGGSRRRSEE